MRVKMTSPARRRSTVVEFTDEDLLWLRRVLEEQPVKSTRRREALLDVALALHPRRSRIQVQARERCRDAWHKMRRGVW